MNVLRRPVVFVTGMVAGVGIGVATSRWSPWILAERPAIRTCQQTNTDFPVVVTAEGATHIRDLADKKGIEIDGNIMAIRVKRTEYDGRPRIHIVGLDITRPQMEQNASSYETICGFSPAFVNALMRLMGSELSAPHSFAGVDYLPAGDFTVYSRHFANPKSAMLKLYGVDSID